MTHAGKEAIFLEHIFGDVGILFLIPTTLLIDNQSTITLAENPIFHAWTKHIDVHHHWVCEKVKDRNVELKYIPMADQTVDIFMKPLDSIKFKKFCNDLGLSLVKLH